jgi:hypothetical protein
MCGKKDKQTKGRGTFVFLKTNKQTNKKERKRAGQGQKF